MTKTITIAPVKKSIVIECSQAHAFDVFTTRTDQWWPKEHHIGNSPVVKDVLEPRKGGRWYSVHEDGSEITTGRMLEWDPPRRLVFSWEINGQWKPETNLAFSSEVEVKFTAEGPERTRVDLEHRRFERMPDVQGAKEMRDGVDGGWPGILDLFKSAAEG